MVNIDRNEVSASSLLSSLWKPFIRKWSICGPTFEKLCKKWCLKNVVFADQLLKNFAKSGASKILGSSLDDAFTRNLWMHLINLKSIPKWLILIETKFQQVPCYQVFENPSFENGVFADQLLKNFAKSGASKMLYLRTNFWKTLQKVVPQKSSAAA